MKNIVSITDSEHMSRMIDLYLRCFMNEYIDFYFMTYNQKLLSNNLFSNTDLFILELFRRDDIGYSAEAIFIAEKWAALQKKILIISGCVKADIVKSVGYWDIAASDSLQERVSLLLDSPVSKPEEYYALREVFKDYYRPVLSYH